MAQSLYRKYRPQTFADVVGQAHIEQTIRNAVETGTVSHAYLFCGPRGTGKTTTARLLAKALLCEHAPTAEPDGTCTFCTAIAEGLHPDVYELDAASRTGVENVRDEIISRVQFSPTQGAYKVYIIDEVHMLSVAAFNALLKTLEEPPAHIVFILCTTDPQKVPATILSRCQRFDFHRLAIDEIAGNLARICEGEDFTYEQPALELIARQAQGGMRDAITTLEQAAIFGGGKVTFATARDMLGSLGEGELFRLADLVAARDIVGCLHWLADFCESGSDVAQLARDLTLHFRDLYVVKLTGGDDGLVIADAARLAALRTQADLFDGPDRLARIVEVFGTLTSDLRTVPNARLAFEIVFTRLARPDADMTLESLAERIEALENGGLALSFSQPKTVLVADSAVRKDPAADTEVAAEPLPETGSAAASAVVASAAAAGADSSAVLVSDGGSLASDVSPSSAADVASATAAGRGTDPATPHGATASQNPEANTAASVPSSVDTAAILADAAAVQRLWNAVCKEAKRQRPSLTAVFGGTHARRNASGAGLLVELPADASFALKTLERQDTKELVTEIVGTMFGARIAVNFALSGEGTTQAQPLGGELEERAKVQGESAVTAAAPVSAESFASVGETAPVAQSVSAGADAKVGEAQGISEVLETASGADESPLVSDSDNGPIVEPKPADANLLQQMLTAGFGAGIMLEEDDEGGFR